jgi:hypothetical protein
MDAMAGIKPTSNMVYNIMYVYLQLCRYNGNNMV